MRYSTLLLASSIGLRGSDIHVADATPAAVIPDNDPNLVHTFRNLKSGTRPQSLPSSNEDDERMLPTGKAGQEISEVVAGKAQKIVGTEISSPQAPQKSLKVIFDKIHARAEGLSARDQVETIIATMTTEELKEAVKAFKMQNKFLADEFIAGWEIQPVATALVKARRIDNKQIKANAEILLNDLVRSLDKYTHSKNPDIFDRVKLDADEVDSIGFADARVELLFDLIKFKLDRIGKSEAPLSEGFRGYGDMANIIGAAKAAAGKSVETIEKRFVEYFASKSRYNLQMFFDELAFPVKRNGKFLLQRHQFEMMETFLALKGVPEEAIRQEVLLMLMKGFGKARLAMELTKAVENPQAKTVAKQYEELLFQHIKRANPSEDAAETMVFYSGLHHPAEPTFIRRYKQWLAKERSEKNP